MNKVAGILTFVQKLNSLANNDENDEDLKSALNSGWEIVPSMCSIVVFDNRIQRVVTLVKTPRPDIHRPRPSKSEKS